MEGEEEEMSLSAWGAIFVSGELDSEMLLRETAGEKLWDGETQQQGKKQVCEWGGWGRALVSSSDGLYKPLNVNFV